MSAERRRPWLAFVGLALALLGLPFAAIVWWTTVATAGRQSGMEWIAGILVAGAFSAPLGLGLWLAHLGEPGIGRRLVADCARLVRAGTRPSALRAALRTSFGLALAIALASVAAMFALRTLAPDWPALVAFAALCGFSVLDPILNLMRRSWWVGAMLSVAAWIALFGTLGVVANAVHRIGETGMIFVLPIIGYPALLAISGLAKLFLWSNARRGAPRAAPMAGKERADDGVQ